MDPFLILELSCLCYALQFVFSKLYATRSAGNVSAALWTGIISAAIVAASLLPFNSLSGGIPLSIGLLTVLFAIADVTSLICGLSAMNKGDVSVFTAYSLLGSLVIPFLFGVFYWQEPCPPLKIVAVAILVLSLFPDMLESIRRAKQDPSQQNGGSGRSLKQTLTFHLLSGICFFTNGTTTVCLFVNAKAAENISSGAFSALCAVEKTFLMLVLLVLIALSAQRKGETNAFRKAFLEPTTEHPPKKKQMLYLLATTAFCAIAHGVAEVLSQTSAKSLQASVQSPLLCASVIVFTAVFGRIVFHEKFTAGKCIGMFLCLAGAMMYVFI